MAATETHVNFLGGSPLNRLSWLRPSTNFLSAILSSSAPSATSARWIVFRNGEPLVRVKKIQNVPNVSGDVPLTGPGSGGVIEARQKQQVLGLARVSMGVVRPLLGVEGDKDVVFGQGKEIGERTPEPVPSPVLEAARFRGPIVVFLGLDETQHTHTYPRTNTHSKETTDLDLALSNFETPQSSEQTVKSLPGIPYFALDLSETSEEDVGAFLERARLEVDGGDKTLPLGEEGLSTTVTVELAFAEPRSAANAFSAFDAAVFAEGRSMVDWNARNNFCPGCGSPVFSAWAGWKLVCSSLLPWVDNTGKKPCPSGKGVHNFSHPRTDAVVIMAVIDEREDKILLGRNRRFPNGFYSTLAGFIEPGESFEDAVRREIWEEAGVRVWGARYHSGQPWPYPANLMVGYYAFADSREPVRTDLDNELVDARWYTRPEILSVLSHPDGTRISRRDYKKFDDDEKEGKSGLSKREETNNNSDLRSNAPPFKVPPLTAIAGVLIRDWAFGKIGKGEGTGVQAEPRKGNL